MASVRAIGLSWHCVPGCAGFPLIPSGYRQEALIPEAIAERERACIPLSGEMRKRFILRRTSRIESPLR